MFRMLAIMMLTALTLMGQSDPHALIVDRVEVKPVKGKGSKAHIFTENSFELITPLLPKHKISSLREQLKAKKHLDIRLANQKLMLDVSNGGSQYTSWEVKLAENTKSTLPKIASIGVKKGWMSSEEVISLDDKSKWNNYFNGDLNHWKTGDRVLVAKSSLFEEWVIINIDVPNMEEAVVKK